MTTPEGLDLYRAVRRVLPDYTGYTSEEQLRDWQALESAVAQSPTSLHPEDLRARIAQARSGFLCDHNRSVSAKELTERIAVLSPCTDTE